MTGALDRPDSILIASEPLTADTSAWVELQEYSMMSIHLEGGELKLEVKGLEI